MEKNIHTETMARKFSAIHKKKYKIDIADSIRGAAFTQNGWTDREGKIQEGFIWGVNRNTGRLLAETDIDRERMQL